MPAKGGVKGLFWEGSVGLLYVYSAFNRMSSIKSEKNFLCCNSLYQEANVCYTDNSSFLHLQLGNQNHLSSFIQYGENIWILRKLGDLDLLFSGSFKTKK